MALCGVMCVSGNDKSMSGTAKTRNGTVDDPVSAGLFIRSLHAAKNSHSPQGES